MFEYIGHIRIIQGMELENKVRLIMISSLGSNYSNEVQKDVMDMQKEISNLFEYEPELEVEENEDYDWGLIRNGK